MDMDFDPMHTRGRNMKTRILVTGGSGFLGTHVVLQLLAAGYLVRSLQRTPPVEGEHVPGSILEEETIRRAVKGCDAVFHLAGRVSRDRRDASLLEELHVEGTRNVLSATGDRRVVYASTSGTIAVSRDRNECATEFSPYPEKLVAGWPYYASKIRAEKLALEIAGDRVVVLNPSLLLGPGDSRLSSTEDVKRVLEGRIPAIPGGGLNFVDVRDVAGAFVTAMEKGVPGERYLLGGVNWTLRKFLSTVAEIGGVRITSLPAPGMLTLVTAHLSEPLFRAIGRTPPVDVVSAGMSRAFWTFDNSKARSDLDFRPRPPEETLRDTIGAI